MGSNPGIDALCGLSLLLTVSFAPRGFSPCTLVFPSPQGRAWGGDLIVSVIPGVGHLTDLVLPGEGIFESFFARRGDI